MYETVFFDAKELSWLQGRDNCARKLLEEGHKEILQSECYQEYGYPSYINR